MSVCLSVLGKESDRDIREKGDLLVDDVPRGVTVTGRNMDAVSRASTISTDYSMLKDGVVMLKSRETLLASRSEDMSMRAIRPPDDEEEAKAMLARASALGASMLVTPPSPPEIPVDPNALSEDKAKLNALVCQMLSLLVIY